MNESIYVIIAALAPAAVLLWYICNKDSRRPEPFKWLMKGILFGVFSVLVALVVAIPLISMSIFEPGTLSDAVYTSFFGAAIPEEAAKLLMLWLLLRKNPYYDEYLDGIVYAVCIGMGFAGLENIMYLFNNYESWVSVGIIRALISVPAHFFFAVLMGYYFSLAQFGRNSKQYFAFALIVPIIAHGLFDTCLFSIDAVSEAVALIIMIAFIAGMIFLRRYCSRLIRNHKTLDQIPPIS